jgi:RNA polymerase sigma-70 factor (ECF subfamily)
VLGFSAKEVAESLETSVASVNSALQRARAAVDERVPDQSQQETLRSLGDEEIRELVDRYVDAWERNDVDQFAAMLAEDATFAMPPARTWYEGREGIRIWATLSPLSGDWRWRTVFTRANGQPALGFYAWDEEQQAYLPFALNVLTFRGSLITNVTAFIARSAEEPDNEVYQRWPELAADPRQLEGTFGSFGLPEKLD